jgi:hypothetical protein
MFGSLTFYTIFASMKQTEKQSKIEKLILEMQQLSVDAGHESHTYWFTNYLCYSEKVSVKRWCMRNRHCNDVAAHAVQQIRNIK